MDIQERKKQIKTELAHLLMEKKTLDEALLKLNEKIISKRKELFDINFELDIEKKRERMK